MYQRAAVCIAALLQISILSSAASAVPVQWTIASGGNGHFYEGVLFGADINWPEAKIEAENRGGYLATVNSGAEGDFIVNNIISSGSFWQSDSINDQYGPWIGGFQPAGSPEPAGNWQWITGESFSPTFWAAGEPNNVNDEPFLHFYGKNGAHVNTWNDYRNGNPVGQVEIQAFVVEYVVPEPVSAAFAVLAVAAPLCWRTYRKE